ncbi:hypothetical protein SLS62_002675 [Diatrype stigma]|uniref:Beta-lactamase-related domain-containing protein n=1 Tax=Diatrype stigma TaxID=117547 RepID=A0AAN9YUV0_9PEZI
MAQIINKVYEDAVSAQLLPGISVFAGDKNASLKEGDDLPFTASTICHVASMSKLLTSVAALQCVEDGTLNLDEDVKRWLPDIGKYGIITGFDDDKNSATFSPDSTTITLRMLLSHTSGHEYDWLSPLLMKWRASRNEGLWGGATVEDKSVLPLTYTPGTGFSYGAGHDWAGRAVEVAANRTLEEFMLERIWKPLGIENDASFYPATKDAMKDRMATLSSLDDQGQPPAKYSDFDLLRGGTACLGGGGCFTSAEAYYKFLSAVLRHDPKLLTPASYQELFRPQLDEKTEQALNDYLALSPAHTQFLGMCIPGSIRKTWSFAGLVIKDGQEGRFSPGTIIWGGVPSCQWFIDHEAGTCGVAMCQILPPMHPAILALHERFQSELYQNFVNK